MNYLLVGLTFLVLATVVAACAVLGTDRLMPGRRVLDALSSDGVDAAEAGELPLILSDHPRSEEMKRIRFSTSLFGYHKDEVDGVIAKLIDENARLRSLLDSDAATDGTENLGKPSPERP